MEKIHEKGWIKLYRKMLDNELMVDPKALTVFIWLLLKVNDKGQKIIGRLWVAKELRMNPNTLYKVLQRLQNKYQVIDLATSKVTIKYTVVTIHNWRFYQYSNRLSNNQVTIKQHSYIIENKEKETFNTKKTRELREKANALIGRKV